MVQEIIAIKAKLYENVERLENRNRKLELEVNALVSENSTLKAIIKQYEKEAKSSSN